jgi:hypothetical protein
MMLFISRRIRMMDDAFHVALAAHHWPECPGHCPPPPSACLLECAWVCEGSGRSPATSLGSVEDSVLPLPSCPLPLAPQHLTAPPATMAHVCTSPKAMAMADETPGRVRGAGIHMCPGSLSVGSLPHALVAPEGGAELPFL